jgi:peptide/nickel transport system permease protein
MVKNARLHLFDSPHLVLFPAAAVACAVLGFNFLGDALRDQLDPCTRLELGLRLGPRFPGCVGESLRSVKDRI